MLGAAVLALPPSPGAGLGLSAERAAEKTSKVIYTVSRAPSSHHALALPFHLSHLSRLVRTRTSRETTSRRPTSSI